MDVLLPGLTQGKSLTLASAFPLFFGIATPAQARQVAQTLERDYLWPGGWVTSRVTSGAQWDAPNGWSPLQWIVCTGLRRYGFDALAREGARRWVGNVTSVWKASGRLLEKYNVETPGAAPADGEYVLQDGFGWTNGVLLRLLDEMHAPTVPEHDPHD